MRRPRAGFSLIEALVSVVVVGVMLAVALSTVGASRTTQHRGAGRTRGHLLAQGLMSEIMQQAYQDPQLATLSLGRDGSESGANRAGFDDVDDYDGWSASPPQQRDGTPMSDLAGWRHEVEVAWVSPLDTNLKSASETGAKRVTVTVSLGGVPMAVLDAVRTSAFPQVDR